MRTRLITLLFTSSLTISACTLSDGDDQIPPSDLKNAGSCQAVDFHDQIGAPYDAANFASHSGPARIMQVGDAATTDYSPDRLNIMLDSEGSVVDIWCG